jgi:hypothetical protein
MLADDGRMGEAEAEVRAALEPKDIPPTVRANALAASADILRRSGRTDAARAAADAARTILRELGTMEEGEELVRLAHAACLQATGALSEARTAAAEAHAWLLGCAAKIDDEELRRSFLERVPDHARLLALAAELGVA